MGNWWSWMISGREMEKPCVAGTPLEKEKLKIRIAAYGWHVDQQAVLDWCQNILSPSPNHSSARSLPLNFLSFDQPRARFLLFFCRGFGCEAGRDIHAMEIHNTKAVLIFYSPAHSDHLSNLMRRYSADMKHGLLIKNKRVFVIEMGTAPNSPPNPTSVRAQEWAAANHYIHWRATTNPGESIDALLDEIHQAVVQTSLP
mmetsp:Transcript_4741/g.13291  ORF Transcript_4741/g.13291 Transcript_4741/m.13291 type:complete len:200 (-) Transcript_4741:1038-1637(-)